MNLTITSILVIPSKELRWQFSRASGPGGQNVNKTETKVELLLDIQGCSVLSSYQKKLLEERLKDHIVNGFLRVVVQEKRTQYQNRQLALFRIASLIRAGLRSPLKMRRETKPSFSARKRRVDLKKQRGLIKKSRQEKPLLDD